MRPHALFLAPALLIASVPASAEAADPLRFFEGRTESSGTAKVVLHKAYRTHTLGRGRIERDGTLTLVQRVEDEGKPPHERRWQVRQTGPGHYLGTMTDALGPVVIERAGSGYVFRFTMKGNLGVEQWLKPLDGGSSAESITRVKKFGMTVATSDAVIRRLPAAAAAASARSSDAP
jgi:hypothetical protein